MYTSISEHTIEYLNVNEIVAAPFNPASRTEKRALTKLRREIEAAGGIIVPLVISGDNVLADGHRRLAIAKELGMETVPVVRHTMPVADLWRTLNGATRPVTAKTWMEAVHDGMPLESVPDAQQRLIGDLIRIVGRRAFDALSDKSRSPHILSQARMVGRHCGDLGDRFLKKVILWFEAHEMQLAARKAVDAECPPEVLIAAIEENRPIREYWGIG
jgi:hypothetical protein